MVALNTTTPLTKLRNYQTPQFKGTIAKKHTEVANKEQDYKNPIKSGFEYIDATKATLAAAVVVTGRVLLEFSDGDAIGEIIDAVYKAKKSPNNTMKEIFKNKRIKVLSLIPLAIAGVYFVTHLPKNIYKKKIETFQKKKEIDVYTRTNSAEKALYERVHTESLTANDSQKNDLAKTYLKLRTAKQKLPDFVNKY